MIQLTFPDNSKRTFKKGVTGVEIAKSIAEGLARNALGMMVNDELQDLSRPIFNDSNIKIITWDDEEGKKMFWHSSAHLMAEALEATYPGIKFGIGPAIENGFYYDVEMPNEKILTHDDFQHIEKKIIELAKTQSEYIRKEVSKKDAIAYFTKKNDPYKLELLEELEDGSITFYNQGEFTDLCRGPHIPNTARIKAIKLMNIAGAYWRGNEKNKQLTRIYGISFPKTSLLKDYLEKYEEAQKRDHRKLGKELELFTFSEKVGAGLPLWLPKGTELRERLVKFLHETQIERGYQSVITPHIGHVNLYKTSGHYEKYGADSFQLIKTPHEGEAFMLKPMNCPHHCEIYKSKPRSYKDLPLRIAEFGTVYRYEQSGELHGLTRVRGFTQDDAHIFCTKKQIKEEFKNVIELVLIVLKKLGFTTFSAQISLSDKKNPQQYIGKSEDWVLAEQQIMESAEECNLTTISEEGEAAFYGPKLDFMIKDALGRKWQLGTIQVDYNLPERFELEFTNTNNEKERPVMIHRAPFGSLERIVALIIENCGGHFPFWLVPTQCCIMPISEKYKDYAEKVVKVLKKYEIRTELDNRDEKIGKKIRDAEMNKIPYMVIIGEKEKVSNTIALRQQKVGEIGTMGLEEVGKFLSSKNTKL